VPLGAFLRMILFYAPGTAEPSGYSPAELVVYEFELTVLVSPDETILRYHLAAALAHSGNVEAAMPHFQQSVGDAAAHYNIGVILYRNALQASREKFLEALEKNPDLKEAELWLNEVSGARIP